MEGDGGGVNPSCRWLSRKEEDRRWSLVGSNNQQEGGRRSRLLSLEIREEAPDLHVDCSTGVERKKMKVV